MLLLLSLTFMGCVEVYDGLSQTTYELYDSYLDAQIVAEEERRKRELENSILLLEERRVSALEKLVDSIVYVNEAQEFHHAECRILSRSKLKTPVKLIHAVNVYSACSYCAP